jgi:hypothetical protein
LGESGVTTALSPSRITRVIHRGFRAARSRVQSKTIRCVYRSWVRRFIKKLAAAARTFQRATSRSSAS